MDRVPCATCGVEHDLSDLEPAYAYPDAYLDVPPDERVLRTTMRDDDCRVRGTEGTGDRYFLRVLLPMPVRGDVDACAWGVWAEVNEAAFRRIGEVFAGTGSTADEPMHGGVSHGGAAAFDARLANALVGYGATLGLPGSLRLSGPFSAATFTLAPELDHPLAREQRDGVHPERVIEWLFTHLH